MTRLWIWAFGPRGEGFALLAAILAAAGFYVLIVAGIVAAVSVLMLVAGFG